MKWWSHLDTSRGPGYQGSLVQNQASPLFGDSNSCQATWRSWRWSAAILGGSLIYIYVCVRVRVCTVDIDIDIYIYLTCKELWFSGWGNSGCYKWEVVTSIYNLNTIWNCLNSTFHQPNTQIICGKGLSKKPSIKAKQALRGRQTWQVQ